jgi:hypothetical protein
VDRPAIAPGRPWARCSAPPRRGRQTRLCRARISGGGSGLLAVVRWPSPGGRGRCTGPGARTAKKGECHDYRYCTSRCFAARGDLRELSTNSHLRSRASSLSCVARLGGSHPLQKGDGAVVVRRGRPAIAQGRPRARYSGRGSTGAPAEVSGNCDGNQRTSHWMPVSRKRCTICSATRNFSSRGHPCLCAELVL